MKYLIKSEYIKEYGNIIEELLIKRGWEKGDKNVDFVYVDGKYAWNKNLSKLPKYKMINVVDKGKETVTLKNNLYKNMKKEYPKIYKKYFVGQIEIDLNKLQLKKIKKFIDKYKVVILKPIFGFSGSGIKVFNKYDILIKHLKKIKNNNNCNDIKWKKNCYWVLSEYIQNPMLIKKKKFHIRIFMLYTYINNKKEGYLYKKGTVLHAKNDYKKNILNKNISNSHLKTTIFKIYYPNNFKKIIPENKLKDIKKNMKKLFKHCFKLLDVKCINCKNCFEFFGADIMILKDYNIKILEFNDKITYYPQFFNFNKTNYKNLINNIFKLTIDKVYIKDNKNNKDNKDNKDNKNKLLIKL
tara:strand:- start:2877 stop:3938 length:1062 start_codon:yes stop_codon:yes gene_type:complete